MRIRTLLLGLTLPLALWLALPLTSSAGPQATVSSLSHKIAAKQGKLARVHGRAHVLTSDISALTQRIDALQGTISQLQRRQDRIQSELDVKRAELTRTQTQLRSVRARLAQLRARLARSRVVLARRLVELYKSGQPDVISVVLSSKGFAQLLENSAFLQRIGTQDRQIITAVRDAKAQATSAVHRLATLQARQQAIASEISQRRDAVARVRSAVQGRQDRIDHARGAKSALLHRVNAQAHDLDNDISVLRKQESKIEAQLRGPGAGAIAPGPIRGGGRFIWPVNGPITSPFCERRAWEACHPGIDIGVPSGTPIRAAGTGVVAIAGWVSGYGNYTCINHGGGISTCYGHQSRLEVSVGQRVAQGQVIGLSGCTGLCFGPHLHFEVRINGAVTNPINYLG